MFKVTLTGKETFSIDSYGIMCNGVQRSVDEKTFNYLEKTFPSMFSFEKEVKQVEKTVDKVAPKKATTSRKKKTKVEEDS